VEKCGNARTEHLKGIAMQLLSGILKPVLFVKSKKSSVEIDEVRQPTARALESHLEPLSAVLLSIVQRPPQRADYKLNALQFLCSCIDAFIVLYPQKPLSTILDTKALLEGLKTIETRKLQHLITKIEGLITRGAARVPVANEKAANMKSKSLGAKKKKSADAEKVIEMDIEPTPSKKKKKSLDVEKVVENVIESHIETDIALTPSKKKKMSVDVEKVIEVDIVPTPSKKKKTLVDAEKVVEVEIEPTPPKKKKKSVDVENVVVEAEIVQIEQTPSKKKKQKERTSPKTQEMTGKKTKRCRVEQ
jgi:DNA polymerase phi